MLPNVISDITKSLCLLFIHPRASNLISLRSVGTMPAFVFFNTTQYHRFDQTQQLTAKRPDTIAHAGHDPSISAQQGQTHD